MRLNQSVLVAFAVAFALIADSPNIWTQDARFDSSRAIAEKELIEKANQEGSLLWYAIPLPFNELVVQEFKKKYPKISVEVLKAGGTQIIEKFELEQEKNAV